MVNERRVTSVSFSFGLLFYALKRNFDPGFSQAIFDIYTYILIISAALMIMVSINQLKLFYDFILGLLAFAALTLGILLAGTFGLGNSSEPVIEGLSRIILATFAIWKLSSDMRNLKLHIDPFPQERTKLKSMLFGIVFPPKELFRLLKIIFYVVTSFYLIFSGLELLSTSTVDITFFEETEKLAMNVLFLGIQVPMMMASRASISKTFSEYLKNVEWAQATTMDQNGLNNHYREILNTSEVSYDSITSNGKHIWLTILLTLFLQAYQDTILAWDIFSVDYGSMFNSIVESIRIFFNQFF